MFLIFNSNTELGIHSGGFSVKSIMMKEGLSPIITLNSNLKGGSTPNKVSDLFDDLVVPNWAMSYHNKMVGGRYQEPKENSDSEDDVINDDLHDKLLELVKNNETKEKPKNKLTKKHKLNKNKFSKKVRINK